jgi:hypothetical protein
MRGAEWDRCGEGGRGAGGERLQGRNFSCGRMWTVACEQSGVKGRSLNSQSVSGRRCGRRA